MDQKGIPTIPLLIAGKEYSLRFDVQAQIQATQSLKLIGMGMAAKNWWALLNPPYDVSELVAMIQAGINGAKRFNGEKEFIDLEEAQAMLQDHFDYQYEQAGEIDDEQKAMTAFDKAQFAFMEEISAIARAGAGFRKKGQRKEKKPKTP